MLGAGVPCRCVCGGVCGAAAVAECLRAVRTEGVGVVWVLVRLRLRADGGGLRVDAGVRLPNATVGAADGVPRGLEAEAAKAAEVWKGLDGCARRAEAAGRCGVLCARQMRSSEL